MYTDSQKNNTPNSFPQLRQILTDFQISFAARLGSKFSTKSCLNIRPHLKLVATLPCEMCMSLKWRQCEICVVINEKSRGIKKGKGSPYSITERWVLKLIPVLGSHSASDVSHKPGGRLPLVSARPAVTPANLKRAATSFAAW